jgi:hypothetical protein
MYWHNPAPVRHPLGFVGPCLPTISRTVPTGPGWAYEIKHDGFRFICRRNGERVRLFSRGGHDWSAQLPAIVEAMRAFPVKSVTLDGEVVICGTDACLSLIGCGRIRPPVVRARPSCMRSICSIAFGPPDAALFRRQSTRQ